MWTHREVCLFIEGVNVRREAELELVAWHLANSMNAQGVKPKQTVKRLLGRDRVIDNDAAAAMISAMLPDPKTANDQDALTRDQIDTKVQGFRKMMKRKTMQAKALHKKKLKRERAEKLAKEG